MPRLNQVSASIEDFNEKHTPESLILPGYLRLIGAAYILMGNKNSRMPATFKKSLQTWGFVKGWIGPKKCDFALRGINVSFLY